MALRRWKPFLGAFEHIDAAIESASTGPGCISRDEFKRARIRIVETLCGATDDAVAEEICRLLDDAMAESLLTLQAAAAARAGTQMEVLASGEVVEAVGALSRGHVSGRIRGLARDVVRGWRAAVEAVLGTATAAMHALDAANRGGYDLDAQGKKQQSKIPPEKSSPCPRKTVPPVVVGGGRVNAVKIAEHRKMPLVVRGGCAKTVASKKPPAGRSVPSSSSCCSEDTKKMEATKRKLHAGYQEAEDAKRRRTIQVVTAPEMLPQKGRRRTTHPAVKVPPACSAAETRRFNASSSLRRV